MSGTSMASPHTAGLLAYLLSIHGTDTFRPILKPNLVPQSLQVQLFSSTNFRDTYTFVHSVLPDWAVRFLPPPGLVHQVAPIPEEPSIITPKQLKEALLALATKNALKPLPAGSPNLLIFNNATLS